MKHTVLAVLCLIAAVRALDNGLGRTPQMAWNSWNTFACDIDEDLIKDTAKAMVTTGLAAVGFNYVNMDDCWAESRTSNGFIVADPKKFPSGVKALADYVHSLGLKFGLYSDAGNYTCATRPGSLGYETQDATQYAAWGVDYLKYDNCFDDNLPDPQRYTAMRDALNKTGRAIFFSMCDWKSTTAGWAPPIGNSWRTTTDIWNTWDSWTHNLDQNNVLAKFAAPGGWNDPDMLEVGNDLPQDENIAHYSLWALMKAPLILGNDLRNMSKDVLDVLTNTEVLAVNQDPLGVQGYRIYHDISADPTVFSNVLYVDDCGTDDAQVWSYDSSKGTISSKHAQGYCVGQWVREWDCYATPVLGAPMSLQACGKFCNGTRQTWILDSGSFKTNFVGGPKDPQCVEVNEDYTGEVQVGWTCTGAPNQKWTYTTNGQIKNQNGKCLTVGGGREVWAGQLQGDAAAVVLFNRAEIAQKITVSWSQIGRSGAQAVRDLWLKQDLGTFNNAYSATVNPHGAVMLKITNA
jgi:alpha-galactosidase